MKNEIDTLIQSHTREEIDGMARALGLNPSEYRSTRDIAKAILESLPSDK